MFNFLKKLASQADLLPDKDTISPLVDKLIEKIENRGFTYKAFESIKHIHIELYFGAKDSEPMLLVKAGISEYSNKFYIELQTLKGGRSYNIYLNKSEEDKLAPVIKKTIYESAIQEVKSKIKEEKQKQQQEIENKKLEALKLLEE